MTRVSMTVRLDLWAVIEDALQEVLESVTVEGAGDDGESEYEVVSVEVMVNPDDLSAEVEYDLLHVSGKFASKDSLGEVLEYELGGSEVDVSIPLDVTTG